MEIGRMNFGTVQLQDDSQLVHILGGWGSQLNLEEDQHRHMRLGNVETFNVTSETWVNTSTPIPPMIDERSAFGVASVVGKIFVFGGVDQDLSTIADSEVYDVMTGRWAPLPPMEKARSGCKAVVWRHYIFVVGGLGMDDKVLDTVEVMDWRTHHWMSKEQHPVPRMLSPRWYPSVVVLFDRLYAIGGYDMESALDTAEVLDLGAEEEEWVPLKSRLTVARGNMATVTLYDRFVMVAGGFSGIHGYLRYVDILDTAVDTFYRGHNITRAREGSGMVATQSSVYLFGGYSQQEAYMNDVRRMDLPPYVQTLPGYTGELNGTMMLIEGMKSLVAKFVVVDQGDNDGWLYGLRDQQGDPWLACAVCPILWEDHHVGGTVASV
eukprot:CAMPEP_0116838996 /NCGR_PEP_ID=MMETSP0418-20121206/9521_1 /TAXON_ID=1158023 /ORGANISM="Astrosyne radiata, Strain 13vi08-1A" /LENGTH=378 /DNA_ID=CAMNT_0004469057 /DNA_START=186 /DNA_END=1323 /DNA_ORIENTATION=+